MGDVALNLDLCGCSKEFHRESISEMCILLGQLQILPVLS